MASLDYSAYELEGIVNDLWGRIEILEKTVKELLEKVSILEVSDDGTSKAFMSIDKDISDLRETVSRISKV